MSENSEGPKPSLDSILIGEKTKIENVIKTKKEELSREKENERLNSFGGLSAETKNLREESNLSGKTQQEIKEQYKVIENSREDFKKGINTIDELYSKTKNDAPEVLESYEIKDKKDFVEKFSDTAEIEEVKKNKTEMIKNVFEAAKKIKAKKKELVGDKKISKEKVMELLNEKIRENDRKISENEYKKVDLVVEQVFDWAEVDADVKSEIDSFNLFVRDNKNEPRIDKIYVLIKDKFGEEMVEKVISKMFQNRADANPGHYVNNSGFEVKVKNILKKAITKIEIMKLEQELIDKKGDNDRAQREFELVMDDKKCYLDSTLKKLDDFTDPMVTINETGEFVFEWREIKRTVNEDYLKKVVEGKIKKQEELLKLEGMKTSGIFKKTYKLDEKKITIEEMEDRKTRLRDSIESENKWISSQEKRILEEEAKLEAGQEILEKLKEKFSEIQKDCPEIFKKYFSGKQEVTLGKFLIGEVIKEFYENKTKSDFEIIQNYYLLIKKRDELLFEQRRIKI